jgi:NAD-dependent deacetylase
LLKVLSSQLRNDLPAAISTAVNLIKDASYPIVITGAGISTPSGIPDFRSPKQGLWKKHDPIQVASLSAFKSDPYAFYEWLHPLAKAIYRASPNAAHLALAQLQQAGYLNDIITQNIDPLHQQAGAKNVHQVHGALDRLLCLRCQNAYDINDYIPAYIEERQVPVCPECGSVLKPDVVLYGELLPLAVWQAAEEAVKKCDLMIVAGSSLEVTPVSSLPLTAVQKGVKLIIINHTATYIDPRATLVIKKDVAEILPEITYELLNQ